MVGHQHEAEQLPAEPAHRLSQSIGKALVVRLVVEDLLTRITPTHNMIDGAWVLNSQRPAHSRRLTPREHCVNRLPDPIAGSDDMDGSDPTDYLQSRGAKRERPESILPRTGLLEPLTGASRYTLLVLIQPPFSVDVADGILGL